MNKSLMERNITLDYFKLFLAILVITIHLPIESTSSRWLYMFYHEGFSNGLARIAVPCFFIINGYFLKIDSFDKVKKYIIHIAIMYFVWMLFYLPWYSHLDIKSLIITAIGGFKHLWYLIALIEVVFVFYIINRIIKSNRLLFIVALALFLCGYIIQLNYPFGNDVDLYKYRNFLFVGLPFVILGNLIQKTDVTKYKKIVKRVFPFALIIFFAEVIIAYNYLHTADIYLSLFLICPLSLALLLNYPIYSDKYNNIGLLSSAIYLSHYFIIKIALDIFEVDDISLFPFVVFITIFFSAIIIYTNKTIKVFL